MFGLTMTFSTKEIKPSLAELPLKFIGSSA